VSNIKNNHFIFIIFLLVLVLMPVHAIMPTPENELKIREFCSLFNETEGDIQSYLFLTDTHSFGYLHEEYSFREKLYEIEAVYKNSPTSFVISGGDWANQGATQEEACIILGKLDAITSSTFDRFYHVLGNHDTNYQGLYNYGSELKTGELINNTVPNLLFRDYGRSYYSFESGNTKNYVLDTGLDWTPEMSEYRWEQVDWLAESLLLDDAPHSTVFMHIGWDTYEHDLVPMTDEVTKIANAYNTRAIITSNDVPYDFSACTGTFSYVMTGHMHEDYNALINDIMVVTSIDNRTSQGFDLCLADYSEGKLYLMRIGQGKNRTIDIK